jgi:F0F1-type ATP synthase epsilon subunit
MNTSESMWFTIQASAAPIWEGQVTAIESENREGPFTILPDHANFMTPISAVPVVVTLPDGNQTTYEYEQAVLFLQNNHAKLYVHSEETT